MAKTKTKESVSITEGPLLKGIILFAVPVMLTGLLQLLFTSVDNIVIGQFVGSDALAAIGTAVPLVVLVVEVLMGLSTGASVSTAQAVGSKNKQDIHEVVHTAMLISIIGGIAVGILGILITRPALGWMNVEQDLMGGASAYLMIYFAGLPFMMFYNFGAGILRSVGDTKHPLIFLIIGGVLNLFLNLFFVLVCHLAIAGVALGTVISQMVSAVLVWQHLSRTNEDYKLELKKLRIYPKKLKKILMLGVPAGIQGMVFSLSNVLVQSSVNTLGAAVMAGNSAASNFEGFIFTAVNGFYHACVTYTAQHMGAKKVKRMNKSIAICAVLSFASNLAINMLVLAFARPLLGLFIVDNPAAIDAGVVRMLILCPFHCLCSLLQIFLGATQAMGATITPVIVAIAGSCGFRITWLLTVFNILGTAEALFWCYPASWIFTFVAMFAQFMILRPSLLRKNGLVKDT